MPAFAAAPTNETTSNPIASSKWQLSASRAPNQKVDGAVPYGFSVRPSP
jgi:hypothetical protein